jgi:hypothetical protein
VNISTPPIKALVREQYLRNLEDGYGKFHECIIFGMTSIPGFTPLFHCHMKDGGLWWRAPISAFCSVECEPKSIWELVLWDSFSYHAHVITFDYMKNSRMSYFGRDKTLAEGHYVFTIDWFNDGYPSFAELPSEHKCAHLIALDSGHFALQPNNRCNLFASNFTTSYKEFVVERKTNTHIFTSEDKGKWVTDDSDKFNYDIKEDI